MYSGVQCGRGNRTASSKQPSRLELQDRIAVKSALFSSASFTDPSNVIESPALYELSFAGLEIVTVGAVLAPPPKHADGTVNDSWTDTVHPKIGPRHLALAPAR